MPGGGWSSAVRKSSALPDSHTFRSGFLLMRFHSASGSPFWIQDCYRFERPKC